MKAVMTKIEPEPPPPVYRLVLELSPEEARTLGSIVRLDSWIPGAFSNPSDNRRVYDILRAMGVALDQWGLT